MAGQEARMIWYPGDRVEVQTPDNLRDNLWGTGWPETVTGTVHKTRKNGWVVVRVDNRGLADFLPEWLTRT